MPTMTIYRNNELIWIKDFDPPENGVLELDEPVAVEKDDQIILYDRKGAPLNISRVDRPVGDVEKFFFDKWFGHLIKD